MAESSATSHHGQLDAGSLSRSMRNESGGSAGATDRPIETQPTETRVEGGADPASNAEQDAAPLSGPSSAPTPSSDRWSAAEIARSYEHCRSCVRTRARNFYYGLMLTPEPRRSALCAFYAWSRMADDLADGDAVGEPMTSSAHSPEFGAPGSPPDAGSRKAALNAFWSATLAAAGIGEATSQERAERDEPSAAAAMSHADLLWPAIAEVMRVYDLRPALLRPMCEGQLADLDRSSIPSFSHLERYCFRVAGCVGLACVRMWGLRSPWPTAYAETIAIRNERYRTRILPELIEPGGLRTPENFHHLHGENGVGPGSGAVIADLPHVVAQLAEWRGIAFQLTSILRDFAEDDAAGRTYIPDTLLDEYELDPPEVRHWSRPAECEAMIRQMVALARGYYVASAPLETFIDPPCIPTLAAMTRIYSEILDQIDAAPESIALGPRPRLGRSRKLSIAVRTILGRRKLERRAARAIDRNVQDRASHGPLQTRSSELKPVRSTPPFQHREIPAPVTVARQRAEYRGQQRITTGRGRSSSLRQDGVRSAYRHDDRR